MDRRGMGSKSNFDYLSEMGGFGPMFGQVMMKRGDIEQGGLQGHPSLQGLPKERLAELDRFSSFGSVGEDVGNLGYLPAMGAALGYEYLGKSKPIGKLLSLITGSPEFEVNEQTSPPSFGNIRAASEGYLAGANRDNPQRKPSIFNLFRRDQLGGAK